MRFSERTGFVSPRTALQYDTMDDDLRNSLWNVFYILCWKTLIENTRLHSLLTILYRNFWVNYFKLPLDKMPPNTDQVRDILSTYFSKCLPHEAYDFIEFTLQHLDDTYQKDTFRVKCNVVLEREKSAFRFVGDELCPITSETEISEIEKAMTSPFSAVNAHLSKALEHLSDRENPDYRNSIKESICAVESLCKLIAGMESETFGRALPATADKLGLHQNVVEGIKNLYWYTCDANGIRHALMDEPNVEQEDAIFFLVSCSAFVNYLLVKAEKAGIKLE